LSSTVGYIIIAYDSSEDGIAYSLRACSSAISLLLCAFHLLSRKNLSILGTNSPRLLVLLIQELKTPKVKGKKKKKEFFSSV